MRKFKTLFFLLAFTLIGITGFVIYNNTYNETNSFVSGTGELNDPYILKNNQNKLKEKLDHQILDYLNYSQLETINIDKTARTYEGVYVENQKIFIEEMRFVDFYVAAKLWITCENLNKLPEVLKVVDGNTDFRKRLELSNEYTPDQIEELTGILGEKWTSSITVQEKNILDHCISNNHGIISLTYSIQYEDHWYKSSLIYKWNGSQDLVAELPTDLVKNGYFK